MKMNFKSIMVGSKHYLVYVILILTIIGVIFISGCTQSPETEQQTPLNTKSTETPETAQQTPLDTQSPETKHFVENLTLVNENLRISLKNIHTDFHNYDIDYSVNRLMNMYTITDSMITGMEKEENNIKEDMSNAEETISYYKNTKQSINTNELSEDEKNVMNEINSKIEDYNSNKEKLNSCLSKMETYREWVILVRDNIKLMEKWDNQLVLLNEYVQSEKYQDALEKVSEIQDTVSKLKQNAQERKATGIQTFSTEAMESYDAYAESFEYYKEYINLLIEGDYDSAESKYTEYSQKYSEAISMGTDEEASITETINEADSWYQNNIGVCLDLFRNYS